MKASTNPLDNDNNQNKLSTTSISTKRKVNFSNPFDSDFDDVEQKGGELPYIYPRDPQLNNGNSLSQPKQEKKQDQRLKSAMKKTIPKKRKRDIKVKSEEKSIAVTSIDSADETAVERFLVSHRVYGYPNTSGNIISNYIRFVSNNHPLLSLCLKHKNHPFTFKRRLLVFICILAFAIALSYILLSTSYVYKVK
jgi:hypothetical protein